jgi:hypothetical protein
MPDTIELNALYARILQLESQAQRSRRWMLAAVGCSIAMCSMAARGYAPPEVLTVRGLIVVDAAGRSRISIGDMPGNRRAPSVGMAVRDTLGDERFGVALAADGLMGMGFDAPRGAGRDANRERINISAGPNGLASIRFLDRETIPRGYLSLSEENRVSLLLNADTAGKRTYRLYSALHDTAVTGPIR